jgi:hypothetical protein
MPLFSGYEMEAAESSEMLVKLKKKAKLSL